MNPIFRIFPLFLLLFLASCASPQKRIRQNQALFDSFPAEAQARIAQGEIEIGDSMDMVRIAKGNPQYRNTRKSEGSEVVVWRWTMPQVYSATQPVYTWYGRVSPQLIDVTQTREIETLRVEFVDDTAVVIDELDY